MKYKKYNLWKCIIADITYKLSGAPIKEKIDADIDRFLKWSSYKDDHSKKISQLNYCLLTKKEFRSIFYFRIKSHPAFVGLSRIFLKDIETIEFGGGEIGGGLLVSHYHAVIFPKQTGKNFRVGPGVVIGRNGGDFPKFGDNVYIAANATVIGDITIGDNVIIGAGSVVTHSLEGNGVYVGNPVRKIKDIDENSPLLNEIM